VTRALVWVTPTGWEACIDAARALDAEVTLLQVIDEGPEPSGMLGRHRHHRHHHAPVAADDELLDAAADRLGRTAERRSPPGHPEHAVVEAAAGFDLLIVSRTNLKPGPHSLGHATRFVVDHAPCALLLVWPGTPGPPPV
jgi:nucleotide-binding universal stress UspA family protein